MGDEAIFQGSEYVGVIVPGAYGHHIKNLSFALINCIQTTNSLSLEAKIIGEKCRIYLINEPAFDSENLRTLISKNPSALI